MTYKVIASVANDIPLQNLKRIKGIVMNGKITYKMNEIKKIDELLYKYGKEEFKSPYRSTIPLIELFFHNESEMENIIQNYKSYTCSFEYETPVVRGKGKASCTDLMIYNTEQVFCIEAKRTEPEYENVIEWINRGNTDNKKLVLSGWIELINKKCETKLSIDIINKMPYQLIHRFASACKISQNMKPENSHLFYFFFDRNNESINSYKNFLLELAEITNHKVDIKSFIFQTEESDYFKTLEQLWNNRSGKIDLSDDVIQAIIEGPCMEIWRDELNFDETSWEKISREDFFNELEK